MSDIIRINRAAVLTLWASVVAERLGFARAEALTFGRAVAGLNAYSKGVSLGVFEPTPDALREQRRAARRKGLRIALLHREVPAIATPDGLRALAGDKPISPESVERYLAGKFGDRLEDTRGDAAPGTLAAPGRARPARLRALRAVPARNSAGTARLGR